MRACPSCSGFVPDHLTACPHCGAGGSRWRQLGRALALLIGGGATAVTMAACYGAPPYYDGCPDGDGDTWLPGCYNDDHHCDPDDLNCDCNDLDPSVHPGALDPIDGVDRDCDGKDGQRPGWPLPDAGAVDASWAPDADLPDGGTPPPDAAL